MEGTPPSVTTGPFRSPQPSPMKARDSDAHQNGAHRMIVHEARCAVGGKPDDRCDGQIDVAGEHHQHLPDRHDHQKRGVHRDCSQVLAADHPRIDQSHRNHDRRHGADETDLALRDNATSEGDDAVTLVRRRLTATASLDRGDVGVRIRRCADYPLGVRLGSRESRRLAPLAQDDDPIAHADELGQLRRNEHDRESLRGEFGDHCMDLRLALDVYALGRLVENHELWIGGEPFGQHDLLLVAARKRLYGLVEIEELQPQSLQVWLDQGELASSLDQTGESRPVDRWQRPIGEDREIHDEALAEPVLRHVGYSPRHASEGSEKTVGFPASLISPAVGRSIPNKTRATSVRPLPTRPPKPTTSPARTVKEMSAKAPSRERPVASRTTGPGEDRHCG